MSSLRSTIESLASEFAASVLNALRSASIDELADVAGRGAPTRRGPGRPRSDSADSSAAGAPKRRGRGGRLGRRSAGDISRMIESIVEVLQKSGSGLRAEQIRETLGVEAKELPRPLAEAISVGPHHEERSEARDDVLCEWRRERGERRQAPRSSGRAQDVEEALSLFAARHCAARASRRGRSASMLACSCARLANFSLGICASKALRRA